jgi:PAS domain S-box-containing protein
MAAEKQDQRSEQHIAALTGEERFRLLVNAVTDYAISMLDASGNIASWNAGAERFKDYAAPEVVGRHFSLFYTEEDIARGVPATALQTSEHTGKFEAEGWRVRKDGSASGPMSSSIQSAARRAYCWGLPRSRATSPSAGRPSSISKRRERRCSSRRRWRRSGG